jgi:hypothetical protein
MEKEGKGLVVRLDGEVMAIQSFSLLRQLQVPSFQLILGVSDTQGA